MSFIIVISSVDKADNFPFKLENVRKNNENADDISFGRLGFQGKKKDI